MVLLRTSADGLATRAAAGRSARRSPPRCALTMGRNPSPAEIRSWDASLGALSADLQQAGLGGVEVLLEYQLPLSSKRVDVVLAGEHPRRGGPSYVVVELKQWSRAPVRGRARARRAAELRPASRPAPRRAGARLLRVPDSTSSTSCTAPSDVRRRRRLPAQRDRRRRRRPARLPAGRTGPPVHRPGPRRLPRLPAVTPVPAPTPRCTPTGSSRSRVAPSKQLLAVAAEEIRDREQFVLLDEQRVAYRPGPARGREGPARRPQERRHRLRRAREREERHRPVPARRARRDAACRSCTPPGRGPSPRRCARSPVTGHPRASSCSSTSTSSWTPSATASTS